MAIPRDQQIAGRDDRCGNFGLELAKVPVGQGRSLLHHGKRLDEFGKMRELDAGDRKILDSPRRVDTVIGIGRDFHFSDGVFLDSGARHHKSPSGIFLYSSLIFDKS